MLTNRTRLLGPALLAAALIAACGGSDDAEPTPATGGGTTVAQAGQAINSFDKAQPAVIQIVSKGTFRDPQVGLASGAGAGSGFIISADGLAVTNNHVVAGAATLEVFIGGDRTRSYNATIVGVSECNDLALIDIRTNDSLPYLEWYTQEVVPGIDVYAAGFPLGDPEYTLTRGIVSKARAGGETNWASIDHTIEHDANIQPGNSGGPLISIDGKVVAVNYAGGAAVTTTAQFFGIAAELAQPVIERLKNGDYEAFGINGWAFTDSSSDLSGIWVAGVAPGSPASRARIQPGDIITAMNGLKVGTDGTMSDYCDVIRTAGNKAIAVEVLRWDSGEILRGEINGDVPIELVFSPAAQVQEETGRQQDTTTTAPTYSRYVEIWDDSNTIVVEVPAEWRDLDTSPFSLEGDDIPYIAAAPNLGNFFDTYRTSGMEFAVFSYQDDLEATVDLFGPPAGDCDDLGYFDYSDPLFEGVYHIWDDCGGTGAVYIVLAAVPLDDSYTAVMLVQLTNDADWDALDRIFATFNVFF